MKVRGHGCGRSNSGLSSRGWCRARFTPELLAKPIYKVKILGARYSRITDPEYDAARRVFNGQ